MSNDSESGPFTVDDFIEAGFSQKMAEIWAQASEQAQRALLSIKSNMKATSDFVKTSAVDTEEGLRLVSSSFREATKYSQEYYMVLKVQKDIQNANRAAVEAASSAYAALNQQYIKARDNAKELAVQYGIQSEQARRASAEAMQLQEKLTAIDKSVGQYSRNVGNYSSAWKEYGRAASGAAGLAKLLGEALGLDEGIVRGLGESHMVLREIVRDGGHVQGVFTEEAKGVTEAVEAQTIATDAAAESNTALAATNEEVGASWLASAGLVGIALIALAGIVLVIYEAVEASKALKEANKAEGEELKELIKQQEKLLHLRQDIDVLEKKKTKEQVDVERAIADAIKEQNKAYEQKLKMLEALGNAPTEAQFTSQKGNFNKNSTKMQPGVFDKAAFDKATKEYMVSVNKANSDYNSVMKTQGDLIMAAQQKADDEAANAADKKKEKDLSRQREIELLKDDFIKRELDKELAKLDTDRKFDILEIEKDKENYDTKGKLTEDARIRIGEINTIYDLKDDAARLNYEAEQDKKRTEYRKKQKEAEQKSRDEQEKANKEALDRLSKQEEEFQKLKEKIRQQGLELPIEQDKSKEQSDIYSNAKPNVINADKTQTEDDEYFKTVANTTKKYNDEIKQAQDLGADTTEIIKQYQEQQEIDAQNYENKITEIKKQGVKARMEALQKEAEQTLAAFKEVLAAQNQQQLESLKTDAQMLSTEAQVQAQRAAAGKKNSLDTVLKAEADNAEQQKQLQRKQKQEQDIITYSELLAKAVTAGIGSGKPFTQVLAEAVAAVFTTKATAAGLGAGFYEGTEDTGGPGTLDSLGGKLIKIHPHERIIDAEKNAMLGGVSNEDLVNGYLLNMMLPKVPISDNNKNDELSHAMMTLLDSRLKEVIDGIKSQPIKIVYTNTAGDTVIEETVNGSTHTRVKKNYKIIKTK